MHLKLTTLASVVALAASARATIVGTYYCTQANFYGPCAYTEAESGTCITFSAGGFWNQDIACMRPDTGVACTLYSGVNCTGATLAVKSQMGTISWADKASSYTCVQT
ncbi:uncharacterized protein BT62DRAFT_1080440 [Guyanagaster necrorhizus]|uniref:Uncharacterized protein n=1 Tax=Guyanagaster necrorhizus TaxID=856835 RepID=A0A9P8AMM8_9AGAR|nr:uncharacterized protein BT62DRAFT_1080440 [Guyanagaster necrorhizus MCA 3950]KAG7440914.1 hypothetical protein BT62DRAFT_1080440 [Guyanagaster necrorhizus MCA 3950]